MKRVILDTNVIMALVQLKIDIHEQLKEYAVYIVQGTLDELHKILKEGKGKDKLAAKLALEVLSAKKIDILSGEGYVDDILVEYLFRSYVIISITSNFSKLKTPNKFLMLYFHYNFYYIMIMKIS